MIVKDNIYRFSIFPQNVVQAVSTRPYGSMKTNSKLNEGNIAAFAKAINVPSIIVPHQAHTDSIKIISGNSLPSDLDNTDGLFTKNKNIFIGVVTADCLSIIFYDKKLQMAGVVHAGYKGLLKGIVEKMIALFIDEGSNITDIVVGIAPSIGVCCYNVGQERIKMFESRFPTFTDMYQKKEDNFYLNLPLIAQKILHSKGIGSSQIETMNICTSTNNDIFYSYRAAHYQCEGEFLTMIGMK